MYSVPMARDWTLMQELKTRQVLHKGVVWNLAKKTGSRNLQHLNYNVRTLFLPQKCENVLQNSLFHQSTFCNQMPPPQKCEKKHSFSYPTKLPNKIPIGPLLLKIKMLSF